MIITLVMIIIMMIITVFIITIRNGDSWHPTVVPWGEMVCVDCTCKVNIKEESYADAGDAVTLYLTTDADVYVDHPIEKDNIDVLLILPMKRMETLPARKSGVPH